MSITPFVVTPEIQERLTEIKEYSEANPYSPEDIQKMIRGEMPPAGDMAEHKIHIHPAWKIVYSVNIQPLGKVRQMSISLNKPKALPNPHVVEIVMALFGFKNGLSGCFTDLEDCGDEVQAVNVGEVMD